MKRQAMFATFWSAGDIVLRQGVQFGATLVLARLLTPADFGVVAMASLFIVAANMLMDAGFGLALVQSPDIDQDDKSTVFWCNLLFGIALAISLYMLAPVVADFYGIPKLISLMRFMAITPILTASSAVHFALLTRKLDFRTQAMAGSMGAMVAAAGAIVVALKGGGAWAVATLPVLSAGCISIMLWVLHHWRPTVVFRWDSFKRLSGFGSYVLASSILEAIYSRLYTIVLGRQFGVTEVGFYANADNTRALPTNFLGSMLSRIGLPLFSAMGSNTKLKARGFEHAARVGILAGSFLLLPLIVFPDQVLILLFGKQWVPASALLQILALAGLLYPLHALNLQLLLSEGRSADYFRIEVLKKTLGVSLLIAGAFFGPVGVAWSQVVLSVAALLVNAFYGGKVIERGLFRQLDDVWPPLLAVGISWALAYLLDDGRPGWTTNLLVRCAVVVITFLLLNLVFWWPQLKDVFHSLGDALGVRVDKDVGVP